MKTTVTSKGQVTIPKAAIHRSAGCRQTVTFDHLAASHRDFKLL